MSEQLERNKKAAMAFYDLMFNQCQPRQAIERYTEPHTSNGNRMF